ncbi:MAG: S-layer homology domain-containing protein [Oscillospiraceae bacterium]|nr:S-layer homology domain-containing protein [Oscillospiraceae bacterium]
MKRLIALLLCLLLVLPAAAAGGGADDPVVTRSYLTQIWQPAFLNELSASARQSLLPSYNRAVRALAEKYAAANRAASDAPRYALGQVYCKKGDVLYPAMGCKLLLRDGAIGAGSGLICVTDGEIAVSVAPGKLYMQGDAATSGLTVSTETAELWIDGAYSRRSADGTDYGSVASALQKMGLLRGMGSGMYLERGATRAQGLVMFLRLLGKETEALACTDAIPFTDVPRGHWAYGYVAYAFREGLTNGTSETAFSPDAAVTAQHYATFLMRALHYDEGTDFTYATVLSDIVRDELFGKNEIAMVSDGAFARRDMVYLSYYGLLCADGRSGRLLLDELIARGAVTQAAAGAGLAAVSGERVK